MFKSVEKRVWAFDLEWVPDPLAGRLVHGLDNSITEPAEIEGRRPHLKTYLDEWQRLRELVATREQEP